MDHPSRLTCSPRRAARRISCRTSRRPARLAPLFGLLLVLVSLAGCVETGGTPGASTTTNDSGGSSEDSDQAAGDRDTEEKSSGDRSSGSSSGSTSGSTPSTDKEKEETDKDPGEKTTVTPETDLPPTVKITTSTITGLVPITVEVTIEVTDPEYKDIQLRYDLGLGDEEGNSGTVKIEGAGSVGLSVQYAAAGTFTISAKADDGENLARDSVTVTALSGCPAQTNGRIILIDDDNTDGPNSGWEGTCMTAQVVEEVDLTRLFIEVYFEPGSNVADPTQLNPPKGTLYFTASHGLEKSNTIKLDWSSGDYSYEWKRQATAVWHEDTDVSPDITWEGDHLTLRIPIDDLTDGDDDLIAEGGNLSGIRFNVLNSDEQVGTPGDAATAHFDENGVHHGSS